MEKLIYFDTEKEAKQYLEENGYSSSYKNGNYFSATLCINKEGKEFFGCSPHIDKDCPTCSANLKLIKPNKWFIYPSIITQGKGLN